MHIARTFGHLVGSTLLVAGTSIGLGLLSLPILTASSGFFPSLVIYIVCWAFMLATGLLILEACIWMPKRANLITLSARLLGKWGKRLCWVLYLFLFSCLLIAHITGGAEVISNETHGTWPTWMNPLAYAAVFSAIVYLGILWVDRVNVILMIALLISFIMFFVPSFPFIHKSFLNRMNWDGAWFAFPFIFTAFGYQNLVPTLFNYMNRNVKKTRLALMMGTLLALLVFVAWEFLILGVVPLEGKSGLKQALASSQGVINPLIHYIHHPSLVKIGQALSFFAMTTSYLGISIAFVDFLLDGLKVHHKKDARGYVCLLIFLIPTLIACVIPDPFIRVLFFGGGLATLILWGILPILMIWSGRYHEGYSLMHTQVPGGKIILTLMFVFIVFTITCFFTH